MLWRSQHRAAALGAASGLVALGLLMADPEGPAAAPPAPPAIREPAPPPPPVLVQKRRGLYDKRHPLFQEHDTDADGILTSAEYARGQLRTFVALDANGDGRVERAEYGVLERFRAESVAEEFGRFDADRDGALTKNEYLFGTFEVFRRYDVDRNNAITPEEIALHDRLQQMMTAPRLVDKRRRMAK